jgi:flavodoxin
MKQALIAYFSISGKSEAMAEYIAEGIRFSSSIAHVKNMRDINKADELSGFDGYIFGSPTISLDIPGRVKDFLAAVPKPMFENKLAGAFGSYRHDVAYEHDNHAPALILKIMQNDLKMKICELGPLLLKEDTIETREGIKACQEYGKEFAAELG